MHWAHSGYENNNSKNNNNGNSNNNNSSNDKREKTRTNDIELVGTLWNEHIILLLSIFNISMYFIIDKNRKNK